MLRALADAHFASLAIIRLLTTGGQWDEKLNMKYNRDKIVVDCFVNCLESEQIDMNGIRIRTEDQAGNYVMSSLCASGNVIM